RVERLLHNITGAKPFKTVSKRRIPEWGIRPGLEIGTAVTLRGKRAEDMLNRLLSGIDRKLSRSKFDDSGNFSFGIPEYVHIPDVKYDYTVGIVGLSVAVTLSRPGFSISKGRIKRKIGRRHRITREEAINFISNKYNLQVSD
ncbi:MAG: 50S ribosomal protein L5, partial [Candidatus Parvarchaeota archaeon]|nr:50S ribosomal protein L5 [Candidatus Parvarchaeota archaeon]